jgi:hypothetical protein
MRDRGPHRDETPAEVDRLLRALADEEPDGDGETPADERLAAYREGRLTAEEAREVEGLLARSATGRRRLLALAGIDRSLPLKRVRRAVLGEAARQRRPRRRSPWLSAAAVAAVAAVAATIVLTLLVLLPRPGGLPRGLAFDVAARGLAEVRSPEAVPSVLKAHPETALRISLRPHGESPARLSFTLFRREDGALRRVRQPEEVRLASDRGSATFAGTAAAVLATRTPGVYPLYAVVSIEKELPARVEVTPGEDPARALRAPGRLVYPLTVTLLRDDPPAEEGER